MQTRAPKKSDGNIHSCLPIFSIERIGKGELSLSLQSTLLRLGYVASISRCLYSVMTSGDGARRYNGATFFRAELRQARWDKMGDWESS